MKRILIVLTDKDHKYLKKRKDTRKLTWEEALFRGLKIE